MTIIFQINRGGPEKVEGLVKNVTGECLHVQAKTGQLQINIRHIKSVSLIKGAAKANNSLREGDKEQNTKTDKNENKGKTKQNANPSADKRSKTKVSDKTRGTVRPKTSNIRAGFHHT
jgi:spore coat protein B